MNADRTRGTEAVVIGASAGAVDALGVLLPALPASARIPFVVVVHVPADTPSLLVEIFARRCPLKVRQPFDKQPIEPGIWIAGPDYHLLVESDRSLSVSLDEPVNFSRPSIDVLFESAADVYGPSLAAVVLTGASRDGARGARKVRDAGGLVLVQDPADAEIDIMPRAAIEEASPQVVAPLSELAKALIDISRGRS
ncbi:MAG TPA: chemotaxis protein CheB [Labilithrix sp.]|jgi:two-component system chemotaxis response regulator CheB|nr:chemotaxis protein CheB [Labilithrix sp.]